VWQEDDSLEFVLIQLFIDGRPAGGDWLLEKSTIRRQKTFSNFEPVRLLDRERTRWPFDEQSSSC
jgi:hypothetical protein